MQLKRLCLPSIKRSFVGAAAFILVGCIGPYSTSPVFGLPQDDSAAEILNRAQRRYLDVVRPMLESSCGDCHWGDESEGELNFEQYESLDDLLQAIPKWKRVIRRVEDNEMPPPESEPLSDKDKKNLLDWIDNLVNNIDCTEINPGQPTIRRLNRTEYRNTIRDLTGIHYQPATSFPGDDVGYGFDNIGEVLSLPPILMEKYLDAADEIVNQAIPDLDANVFRFSSRASALDFESPKSSSTNGRGDVFLFSNGTLATSVELKQRTLIDLEIDAYQTPAGDEPAKLELFVGKRKLTSFDVTATSDDNGRTLKFSFSLGKGKHRVRFGFVNDYYVPAKKGRPKQDRNLVLQSVAMSGKLAINKSMKTRVLFELPPKERADVKDYARKIIRRFASLAFRRPVEERELQKLMQLYSAARSEGDSLFEGLRMVSKAILVSPHFLYKVERPSDKHPTYELNSFELATSLSYFLWSTMPDAELLSVANKGRLTQPDVYRAQVQRLVQDDRAKALVENFAGQWLQLRALNDFEPDPDLFPGVDAQLRGEMVWETKMLVNDIFRRDASILELLETDQTFLNQRLAEHYGIEGVKGTKFRRVSLPSSRPGGLLTQASILTLTSNPTRTSPVKRGKWIMENLLGQEPPPPDPSVMQLEDQSELTGTLRQRMEQHRSNPACASCHTTMDALGFSLENFDAVGRWRDTDETLPIDASGELSDGTRFRGPKGLQTVLKTKMREQFIRCFTEKMMVYALGRGLQYYDQCAVDRIIERLEENEYRFSELILGVVESEPFLKRKTRYSRLEKN